MKFYNSKKSIALARNVEIDKNSKGNFNIFAIGDEDSGLYENFLYPNFRRKLGSYIIVDYDNKMYKDTKDMFKKNDFEIERIDLNKEYNPFEYIKNESDIIDFCSIFLRNSNVMKSEEIFYVDIAEAIFELVSLYVLDKVLVPDRDINYVRRIIKKLKQNDVDYFKKIFFKIDESSEMYKNIATLNKMNDKLYQKVLDLILKFFEEIPKNILEKKEEKAIDFRRLDTKPIVLFLEMSECEGLNSLLCTQIQKILYDYSDKKMGLNMPVFFVYNKLEHIGKIPNLTISMSSAKSRSIIYIINFENIKSVLTIYKKWFESVVNSCNYGLIFKTKSSENIEYLANVMKENNLVKMYEDITRVKNGCIVYQKGLKTTEEYQFDGIHDGNDFVDVIENHLNNENASDYERKLYKDIKNTINKEKNNEVYSNEIDEQIKEETIDIADVEIENTNIEISDNRNDENADTVNSLEKVENQEDIFKMLKEDIDKETDSIKREHLIKIYNTFYNK